MPLTAAEKVRRARDKAVNPIRYFVPRPSARAFFYDDATIAFLIGGNRSSKTYSVVARNVMAATRIEPLALPGSLDGLPKPPLRLRHWCLDLEKTGVKVILPIYLRLIPPGMLDRRRGKNGFNSQTYTLHLRDGSFVEFMSYHSPEISGDSASRHVVNFDEPPRESLYTAQLARIADVGGRIWGAMTLKERSMPWPVHWIEKRIQRGGDAGTSWHLLNTDENIEMMAKEAGGEAGKRIREVHGQWKAALSPAEYAVVIEGKGGWAAGIVYKEFDEELHASYDPAALVEGTELRGPELFAWLSRSGYGSIYCGMDQGHNHPTACVWVFIASRECPELQIAKGDYIIFRDYEVRDATTTQNVNTIARISRNLGIWPKKCFVDPRFWNADHDGGLSVAQKYIKAGFTFVPGKNSLDPGVAMVEDLLRPREGKINWPRLRILKGRCRATVDEFLSWQFNPKWSEATGVDKYISLNDDLMDSLRYLAMGRPEMIGSIPQARREVLDPMTGLPLSSIGFGGLAAASAMFEEGAFNVR